LSPSHESGEDDGIESPWGGGTWPEPGGATVVIENAEDEDRDKSLEVRVARNTGESFSDGIKFRNGEQGMGVYLIE
jgi:hypothetical protein